MPNSQASNTVDRLLLILAKNKRWNEERRKAEERKPHAIAAE